MSGITQVTQQLSESVGKAEICYVISTPDGEKLMHLFPEEGKKAKQKLTLFTLSLTPGLSVFIGIKTDDEQGANVQTLCV